MKMALAIIFLLACFGIVGRIDYESSLATGALRADFAHNRQEGQR